MKRQVCRPNFDFRGREGEFWNAFRPVRVKNSCFKTQTVVCVNGRETDRKTIRVDAHFSEDEAKNIVWKLKYTCARA